uniref:Uncharacterized protein n=1 Tax=Bionectria ochroleuca TaxID=29856 RepID=A0A0B7JZE4_BIOOC
MRCSAVVLLTWHMAFLAGVFLDLYSPKYWNFDTIIQQEATMSNILLADKTRYLRAAMLRLVPAAIGIFLRSWAKKSEIPDLSPSGIIWGSTFIMIQLFLAIHLWKQSPKLDGGMRDNEEAFVSAFDLYDRAQPRRRDDAVRCKPSSGWKLFNISHLW